MWDDDLHSLALSGVERWSSLTPLDDILLVFVRIMLLHTYSLPNGNGNTVQGTEDHVQHASFGGTRVQEGCNMLSSTCDAIISRKYVPNPNYIE